MFLATSDLASLANKSIHPSVPAGVACGLLFHRTTGIGAFLERAPGAKEAEEAKALLLEFVAKLIERHPAVLQPFLKDIKVGRRARACASRTAVELTVVAVRAIPNAACLRRRLWPRACEPRALGRARANHLDRAHLPRPPGPGPLRARRPLQTVRPSARSGPTHCPISLTRALFVLLALPRTSTLPSALPY